MTTISSSSPNRPHRVSGTRVAVCPRTGVHLRAATALEAAAFDAANAGRRRGTDRPVLVNGVLIDAFNGPGGWHGGAGF